MRGVCHCLCQRQSKSWLKLEILSQGVGISCPLRVFDSGERTWSESQVYADMTLASEAGWGWIGFSTQLAWQDRCLNEISESRNTSTCKLSVHQRIRQWLNYSSLFAPIHVGCFSRFKIRDPEATRHPHLLSECLWPVALWEWNFYTPVVSYALVESCAARRTLANQAATLQIVRDAEGC